MLAWIKAKALLASIVIVWASSAFLHWDLPYTDFNFYLGYVYAAATLAQISSNTTIKLWGKRWWLTTDQNVNVVHMGSEDETVSSRVGSAAELGSKTADALAALIDAAWYRVFGERNHCRRAIEYDEQHAKDNA